MTRQVTATQAKATFLALLDEVSAGDEIEITRHGRTVARIVAARGRHPSGGQLAGAAKTVCAEEDLFATGEPWNAS